MLNQEIGGYFGIELSERGSFLHSNGCCLNSGRNALEYILLSIPKIAKLWIPYFTCDVILEPVTKLNIPYSFYSINERLEMKNEIQLLPDEYLLVTNYFGIKDCYMEWLAQVYGDQLIVDNAQAYFVNPLKDIKTIYSPRKFVGVPDGGIAYATNGLDINQYDVDISWNRCTHLLERHDLGASEGYDDFKLNSHKLVNQPIRRMSNLTRSLLKSIDFESVRRKRIENFSMLHQVLSENNRLDISSFGDFICPMVYPYYTDDMSLRKKLIDNKIYVATYWPNVFSWNAETSTEYQLAQNILALPIDQRYGEKDMERVLSIIMENY